MKNLAVNDLVYQEIITKYKQELEELDLRIKELDQRKKEVRTVLAQISEAHGIDLPPMPGDFESQNDEDQDDERKSGASSPLAGFEAEFEGDFDDDSPLDDKGNPKLHWTNYVMDTLRDLGHVVRISDVTDMVVNRFRFDDVQRKYISRQLAPVFSRLAKKGDIQRIKSEKEKDFLYGLPEWFFKNGNVRTEFSENRRGKKKKVKKADPQVQNAPELHKFIRKSFRADSHVLSVDELVDRAMDKYKQSEKNRPKLAEDIHRAVEEMVTNKLLGRQPIEAGSNRFRFGLLEWFLSDGSLIPTYSHDPVF